MGCYRSAALVLLLLALPSGAQRTTLGPTTTLRAETGNNTSAPDDFRGLPNGQASGGNVSKLPIPSLLYPGATTRIWVRYMPWFGDKGHIDVGYHSEDRAQVRSQVRDMLSRGITGAIVDWYGPRQEIKNTSTQYLMREAEAQGLQFALSYDKGSLKDCHPESGCDLTGQIISDLSYAYRTFEQSPTYMRIQGRPALFFFGLEKMSIDWRRLRSALPGRPLLFFRNSGAFTNPDDDGGYAWVAPEAAKPGDERSLEYLQRFYRAAREHPDKLVVGSAYAGFNDSVAGWGHRPPRVIPQDCGATWLATFDVANRFFSRANQLPDLLIVTWNDFEEGTAIESGIENCVSVSAALDDGHLRWQLRGDERTLDHFTVFVARGQNLTPIADVPARQRSFDLDDARLAPGEYVVYVKAVGRPSFVNHMSDAVRLLVRPGR